MRKFKLIFLFVLSMVFSSGAFSDELPLKQDPANAPSAGPVADENPFNFNFYIENDTKNIGGPGSDSNYTNGVRLSYLYARNKLPQWAAVVPWLRHYFENRSFNFGVGLNQQIYTPEDLTRTDVIVNDRPYAGWLYLNTEITVNYENTIDTFELDLGVVGPQSFARQVQTEFHRLIGAKFPLGWDHQLGTEIAVLFSYQKKFRIFELGHDWKYFDVLPYVGYDIGNVHDGVDGGSIFRLGYNLPDDFGPARPSSGSGETFVNPGFLPSAKLKRDWSVYVFGGIKGDLVLHNIFIDGSTFQDSQRVTRVPLVGEYEGGIFLRFKKLAVTWREITRSPEFYEMFKPHTFASVEVSYGQHF